MADSVQFHTLIEKIQKRLNEIRQEYNAMVSKCTSLESAVKLNRALIDECETLRRERDKANAEIDRLNTIIRDHQDHYLMGEHNENT